MTITDEIAAERVRQMAQWGEQNHPSAFLGDPDKVCVAHGLPTEAKAKERYEARASAGTGTWADIAVEELSEAVAAAAEGDIAAARGELVQTAAVLEAWIESIDRNGT